MAVYTWSSILLFVTLWNGIIQCFWLDTEIHSGSLPDCGGQLPSSDGHFESPGFPEQYSNDIDCTWTITVAPNDRIHIHSEYFRIEHQSQCLWDYVEIIENGDDSRKPLKYCGYEEINYNSTSNSISVYFSTDYATQDVGFRFKYSVMHTDREPEDFCNRTIREEGYITSPSYPQKYPPNLNCFYNVQAPDGHIINLEFVRFHVEVEPCRFDKLNVYDVMPTGKVFRKSFCGKTIPENIKSRTNSLILALFTDASLQFIGFNVSVTFISQITTEVLSTTTKQTTFSTTNQNAEVVSNQPVKKTVNVITDSISSTQSTTQTTRPMSTSTLSENYTTTTTLATPTASTTLSLYDDDCSYTTYNHTGYISSPGYPAKYASNKNCSVVLRANVNSSIVVQFTNFDLEGSHDCSYDYVVLIPDNNVNNRALLCGRVLLKKIFTFEAETLQVIFRSDKSVHGEGYSANFFITSLDNDKTCELVCANGAKCQKNFTADNIPVWSCLCSPEYYGELCEKKRTTCLDIQCQNGGSCREDGYHNVKCDCVFGFRGPFCEIEREDVFRFVKKPYNTSVARGSSVLLECGVNDPSVDIMWLHRDRMLSIDDHSHGINIYPGGVLMIPDIREEHEGRYTCTARSGDNWIESSAWLSLVGPCYLRVTTAPKSIKRDDGHPALFECQVPDADSIVWHKDGDIIFPDNRKKILVNNYLMITKVVETDAGLYTCVAVGQNGCFAKPSAQLTVLTTGHNEFSVLQGVVHEADHANSFRTGGAATLVDSLLLTYSLNLVDGDFGLRSVFTYCYCFSVCGRPVVNASTDITYRITSGRQAVNGSAPWHVTISADGIAYCGGSLVSENWIITAAHCVTEFKQYFGKRFDKSSIKLFIGTQNCNGIGGQERKIKDYLIYPSFHAPDYNNDLALFQLDAPVTFGDLIMPICLEKEAFTSELFKTGKTGIVTGCGSRYINGRPPEYLHAVTIPYVPREICREAASSVNASFTDYMICAGYAREMQGDACTGDSGGPYSMQFNGRWVLVGIVSWGVGCDRADHYGYYTHISKYYDWIISITADQQIV